MSRIPRVVRCLGLAVGLSFGVAYGTSPVQAQNSATAPATQSASESKSAEGASTADAGKPAEAESGDASKKFLESPTVTAMGKLVGLDPAKMSLVSILLNFAILVVILYFGLRGALPAMFRNRTAAIQKAMEEARRASAEANVRLAEVESRLASLGKEIEQIGVQAEQAAMAEEQRLKAAAETDVKKIVEAAEQEIVAAGRSARRELTAHAADLAVTLAKQRIKVDNPTDEALIRKFAENLQSAQLNEQMISGSGKDGQ